MKAEALICEQCGAGLPAPVRYVSTCVYCGMTHHVDAPMPYVPKSEVRAWSQGSDLHAELAARQDFSRVGTGVRHGAREHPDPFALERALFATHATASSTYGGGWSPRRIATIRIVLDTARIAGWNEIDAIGVVPAR